MELFNRKNRNLFNPKAVQLQKVDCTWDKNKKKTIDMMLTLEKFPDKRTI